MSLPVGTRASSAGMMSSTCKEALVVFTEYESQLGVVELRLERDALLRELALFGSAVGCVAPGAKCSNCNEASADCQCRAWTCRCYWCWVMRRTYNRAQAQGRMVDAAGAGSTGFFRMFDDSADDARFMARLRTQTDNQCWPAMVEELLRD